MTRSAGLMNPNYYLAVAIQYLLAHRPDWPQAAVVGKTVVSSGMIDRVVNDLHRTLWEVPVGFKWFAPGLFDGSCCFGGEESAGASFLRRNGSVWTTDKDGLILGLLAAEITARTGKDPGEHYRELTSRFGESFYTRIDAPATPEQKQALQEALAGCGQGCHSRRRSDHSQTDQRPWQQCAYRRSEGYDARRMVRGPTFGHGRYLQTLCGEFPRARRT